MNSKTYDKIFLSAKDQVGLLNWWADNYKNFKNVLYPLDSAVIEYEHPKSKYKEDRIYLRFEKDIDHVAVKVKYPSEDWLKFKINNQIGLEFDYYSIEHSPNLLKVLDTKEFGGFKSVDDVVCEVATEHVRVMMYMALLEKEFEYKEETSVDSKKIKKIERHNKYNPTNKIKLTRKVYKLINPSFKNISKKEYTRIAQCWSVRGHFRNYKNGLKVWVKPHTKGKGEIKPKVYKIEVV